MTSLNTSKTSIVLISIFRESEIGGVSVHSSNLRDRLAEAGHNVIALDLHSYAKRGATGWFDLLRKLISLRKQDYQLYHFHASNRAIPFHAAAPLLKALGAKLVLSIHSGSGYDQYVQHHRGTRALSYLNFRFLSRLIFMNEKECDAAKARFPQLSRRIVKINPFIAPQASALPTTGRSEQRPFLIVAIGTYGQRYNLLSAVNAAFKLRQEGLSLRLKLIISSHNPEAEYKQTLLDTISAVGGEVDIEVVEDSDDVLSHLAGANLSIRPSFGDSYGLCVAESLLVGTPAIATSVCKRCAAAETYPPGDDVKLMSLIREHYHRPPRPRKNLLAPDEDSFKSYVRMYREIATPISTPIST